MYKTFYFFYCRNIPHGISAIEECKTEIKQNGDQTQPKLSYKTPFPQPLLTRSSYKQDVPQPPLRNIFRRIRRSRRNTKLNMVPQFNGKKQRHCKSVSTNTKQQKKSVVSKSHESAKLTKLSSKRKMITDVELPAKKKKYLVSVDSPANSDEDYEQNPVKDSVPEKLASPLKNLIPRKANLCETKLHRSPAITIKYKSPAGRGRVLNIPSKVHSPLVCPSNFHKSPNTTIQTATVSKENSKNCVVAKSSKLKNKANVSCESNKKSDSTTKAKFALLKEITEVKVTNFPKQDDSQEKSQNNFMVVVNKDAVGHKIKNISKSNRHPVKQLRKAAVNQKQNNKSSQAADMSSPIAAVKSRHLRVVLKPLVKSGLNAEKCSSKDISKANDIATTSKSLLEANTSSTRKTLPKKNLGPCSHTIYVTTCKDVNGNIFTQGDIVWGKLSGYPWWPSRIIKLIVTKTDGKVLQQEAMVGWLRSSTTSIIPVDSIQPFNKKFDIRYVFFKDVQSRYQ